MITLPRLDISDRRSPFDEAVLTIDGHEEETIVIECAGAIEIAERLARFVNHHREIVGALQAAVHALRACEATSAVVVARACEILLQDTGAAA